MKSWSGLKFHILTVFVIVNLLTCHQTHGANILFMQTCSTFSHRVAVWPVIDGLLTKGHNITFISPYGPSGSWSNAKVHEIVPQTLQNLVKELLAANFDVNYRAYGVVPPLFLVLDLFCYQVCDAALMSPEVQKWLQSKPKVDLVVGDMVTECSIGMAEKLKAKHILFSPIPLVTEHFEYLGISAETASVPDYDMTKPTPLSFLNRVTGTLLPIYYLVLDAIYYPWYAALFKRSLGLEKLPGLYELRRNVDLVILNGDYISDYPRSWPPHVVKVEGIHIKKPSQIKPLPKDVEAFISSDGPKHEGFVFMSFGTVAKAPSLPKELKEVFFNAIKSFPNIKFIWKWDGKHPEEEYPKNLLLVSWVDQQDVLAHPKIRGFLTQAGRPSTQEALYHRVATISFPIIADQDFNAQRSAGLGISYLLEITDLTQETLHKGISEILYNKTFKERVNQIANLVKDVPMPPVEKAVWWVEFVLRHSKEDLDLMKPLGRDLYWFQRRELDVWIFLIILTGIMSYLAFYILKRLINRFIFSSKNKQTHSSNTKKSN